MSKSKRLFLNINNNKMAPEKRVLSILKRPGCRVVRFLRTRASSPLSMPFISEWLEKNTQLKKGFSTIVARKATEAPRAERFLK